MAADGEIAEDCYDRALDESERYDLDGYGYIDPWSARDLGFYSRPAPHRAAKPSADDFDDLDDLL